MFFYILEGRVICHRGTITISLKNTIIYVYVYVEGFILTFTLLRRGGPCVHAWRGSAAAHRPDIWREG
jgi:hypothetical protein